MNTIFFKLSYIKTLYFNFHYLPFKQALKLPILIAPGVQFKKLKGKISLSYNAMHFGSILIGFTSYGFQSKYDKTILELNGGELIIKGNCNIGKGTFISIGKFGKLTINENVLIGGSGKVICFDEINIGKDTRIAWEVTIVDSDFHETVNIHTKERSIAKKPISIGNNNWIGFGSTVMKGTKTPNYCVIAAKSILLKNYNFDKYCLLAGHPAKIIKEGIYRDLTSYVE